MKTKISVIVPIYNVENYLEQCLDSIINQTLKEIEIICINDGSTDNSGKILDAYQQTDSRIIVVNKSNAGYGASCNTGLHLAKGEYVSIIEPDDFIDKYMFERLYKLAKDNNADIVKSSYYDYDDCKNELKKINWSLEYNMPEGVFEISKCPQFMYFHPSIWSCIYKNSFLQKHHIFFVEPKGAGWADNPFQVETLCRAKRIVYTDNAYYYYRLTNPNSSSNIVNISNPFDRSDEVHAFLEENNINDMDILAHLYKREFSYIDTILRGIPDDLFDAASSKINKMTSRMDKNIIYNNPAINDYEKNLYEKSKSTEGISYWMHMLKQNKDNIRVVSSI